VNNRIYIPVIVSAETPIPLDNPFDSLYNSCWFQRWGMGRSWTRGQTCIP